MPNRGLEVKWYIHARWNTTVIHFRKNFVLFCKKRKKQSTIKPKTSNQIFGQQDLSFKRKQTYTCKYRKENWGEIWSQVYGGYR